MKSELKSLAIFLIALTITCFLADDFSFAESFWIAFNPGLGKGLLEIDSVGNVIKSPKLVVPLHAVDANSGGVAIANGPNGTILMWIIGRTDAIGRYSRLYRATIDKESVTEVSAVNTKRKTSSQVSLQATQRKRDNFLALQSLNQDHQVLTGTKINEP
jgi:hypothetical protein